MCSIDTEGSVPGDDAARQDRNTRFSVPPPGRELTRAIQDGQRNGRPVWLLPGTVGPAGPEDQAAHEAEARPRGYPIIEVAAMGYPSLALPRLTGTAEYHAIQRRMPLVAELTRRVLCPEVYVLLDRPPPSHLVGLIHPDEMPPSVHAEGERNEGEMPTA